MKMTVKGIIDAPGFENQKATVRLLINDKEVANNPEFILSKTTGNEVTFIADAPATPGEIKVTLKVDPKPKEISILNNEISTFVTVTKEGISVLLVDRARFPGPQRICDALSPDPRNRVFPVWLHSDQPDPNGNIFQFDKRHYDVIILGDVPPRCSRMATRKRLKRCTTSSRIRAAV